MAHILQTSYERPGRIHWEDVWPRGTEPDWYAQLGSSHGTRPPEMDGPVPYRMYEGALEEGGVLPDLIPGRFAGNLIVSGRVKELIEHWETVSHHFVPLELSLIDGSIVTDQYYLFIAGDRVDAVALDASTDVKPKYLSDQFVRYTYPPKATIALRESVIKERHIWVDRYLLPTDIFISDALEAEFQKRGLKHYRTKPCPVFVD